MEQQNTMCKMKFRNKSESFFLLYIHVMLSFLYQENLVKIYQNYFIKTSLIS